MTRRLSDDATNMRAFGAVTKKSPVTPYLAAPTVSRKFGSARLVMPMTNPRTCPAESRIGAVTEMTGWPVARPISGSVTIVRPCSIAARMVGIFR